MMKKLFKKISNSRWKGRSVPVSHLNDLRDAILNRYKQGFIDKELYRDQLGFFSFEIPEELPVQDQLSL